ncbi:MAG: NYN domain-containing protein [Nanoarchaeota archaeon]|nr:NYN domain-containing protein [Nanoarchaeota archaeon]
MKKAIIFVDANNWYHNVKPWFKPSNIDIKKLSDFILKKKNLKLVEIRWYSSMPNRADNELIYKKQRAFLGHLQKQGVKIITRKLQKLSTKELKKKRQDFIESWDLCKICKPIVQESFLDMSDNFQKEKGIDVWIAIDMVKGAIKENIDLAVLISGDADFVPAFNLIKEVGKDVLSCSVPRGYSNELRQKFPYLILKKEILNKCLKENKK